MGEAQQRELVKRGARRSVWLDFGTNRGERRAIKCFHGPGMFARAHDRRRAETERRALLDLAELGFRVPTPGAVAEGQDGVELSLGWIEGAHTLFDLLHGRAPWSVARERVARNLGRVLALARKSGVTFADLHAKNILVDAAGVVWLVDVAKTTLRGRELSDEEHARNVVTMAAELREVTSLAWRLRVVVGCARECGEPVQRADLSRWNALARVRRRKVVARAVDRWTRESSVTTACAAQARATPDPAERVARGPALVLRNRSIDDHAARRALDSGMCVEGSPARVLAAWRASALFTEHALQSCTPIASNSTHGSKGASLARAAFDDHGARRSFADVERNANSRRRAAHSLGCLLGLLHDRGLTLESKLAECVVFDDADRARFTPLAIPVAATAKRDATHLALSLARTATTREKCLFLAGFLANFETTRTERAALRERLSRPIAPVREPPRRRFRARALKGATLATKFIPHALVRGALVATAPLASFSRFDRTARANLALAYGPETSAREIDTIVSGIHRHAGRQFAEWLRLSHTRAGRAGWIDELVEIDASVAILEGEIARRSGALVVSAHIGNWELLAARLRRAGHAGAVVAYRRPHDSTAAWFERMRENHGVLNIAQSAHPRSILRALDEGHVVGLLADLDVRRLAGEFVPFFGRSAWTMSAPAALSRAARRPLIPARCVFDAASGRYRLSFENPIQADDSLDRRTRVIDVSTRLNAVFERWIRAAPEQWAWQVPRWRDAPDTLQDEPIRTRISSKAGLQLTQRSSSLHSVDPRLSPD